MALIDYSKYDMEKFTVEEIQLCHRIRQKYDDLSYNVTARPINSFILLDEYIGKDLLIINCSYVPKCKKPTLISTEITKSHQFHHEHAERLFNSIHDKVYGKIKENPNNPTQKQIKTADLLIATIKKVEVKMEQPGIETDVQTLIDFIRKKCVALSQLNEYFDKPTYEISSKDIHSITIVMKVMCGTKMAEATFRNPVSYHTFARLYAGICEINLSACKFTLDKMEEYVKLKQGNSQSASSEFVKELADLFKSQFPLQKETKNKSEIINIIVIKILEKYPTINTIKLSDVLSKSNSLRSDLAKINPNNRDVEERIIIEECVNAFLKRYSDDKAYCISWSKKYLKSKDSHDYDSFIAQSQLFIEFTDPEIIQLTNDLAIVKEIYDLCAAYKDPLEIETKVIAKSINDKAHLEISLYEQKQSVVKLIDCQSESKGIIIHAHSEIYLSSVPTAKKIQRFINQLILILNKFGKDSPITKYHELIK